MSEPEARFAVDRMLGRLARWLRVLGHDVVYATHLGGRALAGRARREGRVLLTRDTRLCREPDLPRHVFVVSDDFRRQLREVAAAVPLRTTGFLTRCLECNLELDEVARDAAREHVPAFVWETADRFQRCAGCGRLYWPATHRAHMAAELAALGIASPGGAAEGRR